MASAALGIGLEENRPRRRGDAEAWALILCISASLRADPPHAPGDAPQLLSMASAAVGIGLEENRPRRRGDAEAWAPILCVSAPLRADPPHAPGDAPRWLPMASAAVGIGLEENRARRRGDAEAWALILCASAPLRADHPPCTGRPPIPCQQEEPSRSTTLRITAGCVPTRRRSGWDERRLEHPRDCRLRVFVSSCETFPASSPAGSPNETLFYLITRSHEATKPRSHEAISLGPRSGRAA